MLIDLFFWTPSKNFMDDWWRGQMMILLGQIRDRKVVVGGYSTKNGVPELKVKHEPPFHTQQEIERALQEVIAWIKKIQQLQLS